MVEPLRRAKLGDIAAASVLLALFGIVPFALLLSDRSRVDTKSLLAAYTVCLGISWPMLLLGGAPLAFFWRKDRSVDRQVCSTLTAGQLFVVFLGMMCVVFGGVLLLGAEIIELVDIVRSGLDWIIVINVVAILLVCWIVILVIQSSLHVRDVRRAALASRTETVPMSERKISIVGAPSV